MRGAAAIIALLLALAVVGLLTVRRAGSPNRPDMAGASAGASSVAAGASGVPQDRANRLKNEARDGVEKAMSDAEIRRQQADKP